MLHGFSGWRGRNGKRGKAVQGHSSAVPADYCNMNLSHPPLGTASRTKELSSGFAVFLLVPGAPGFCIGADPIQNRLSAKVTPCLFRFDPLMPLDFLTLQHEVLALAFFPPAQSVVLIPILQRFLKTDLCASGFSQLALVPEHRLEFSLVQPRSPCWSDKTAVWRRPRRSAYPLNALQKS